jgi:hypothetical protein
MIDVNEFEIRGLESRYDDVFSLLDDPKRGTVAGFSQASDHHLRKARLTLGLGSHRL